MIVAISSARDQHAVAVLDRLATAGHEAALLDLSAFPREMALEIGYDGAGERFGLQWNGETLDLSLAQAIWWRRPQPFELHQEITDATYRSFAFAECHAAVTGLWSALDAYWVNPPDRDEEAGRKVYQLKVAGEIGLEVPVTLITNNAAAARTFVDRFDEGAVIYKAFSGTEAAWRETRALRGDEVGMIDAVRYAPVIFQEFVPARYDVRITVIGDTMFPAAIYANDTSYRFDYRMHMESARIEAVDLPPAIEERIRAYMQRLGLVYGAIDMRVTPDDRYVFLEINPSGQWRFIEERTDQPMTDTFATLLASHADRT